MDDGVDGCQVCPIPAYSLFIYLFIYLFKPLSKQTINHNCTSDNIIYSSKRASCFGFTRKPKHEALLRYKE
jgi:hypothetical protein